MSGKDQVSVLSWNLLAPSYDENALPWETVRLPALRAWLTRFAACDVICVQEFDITSSALDEVQQLMASHGFDCVVQNRNGFPVVNATFFKASRFQLAWSEHRSRVLLCSLVLRDGRELGIANVHLEAGAGKNNETQRASQLKSALRRLRSHSAWCEVVCGDFNSDLQTDSPLRAQLVGAGLAAASSGRTGPTYAVPGYYDTLDHVWAGQALRPLAVLGSSQQALRAVVAMGLPDREHPSDHLPVAASFRMMPAGGGGPPPAALIAPADVSEFLREEWLLLLSARRVGAPKCEARKQRQVEAAFLQAVGPDAGERLSAWREAAERAAKEVLRAAALRALSRTAAAATTTDATKVMPKEFNPGGCLGGA